ncbi:MAG: alpha/beta hydrolase [Pseudomonadales bacterium]|nr:alpha/beta hydrolase [Pseudomonadales bacterium]
MPSKKTETTQAEDFSIELRNGLTIQGKHWAANNEETQQLPILALHGWMDNCATYNLLGPAIERDVYAVDLAGHGMSSHRPKGVRYHFIDNIDDVLAIADALGFDQFDLMGHSMGAGISTYVTAIAPDRVNKLVLLDGLGSHTSPEDQAVAILTVAVKDMRRAHQITMPIYTEFSAAVAARRGVVGKVSVDAARHLCERGLMDMADGLTWSSDPRLKMGSAMRLTEGMVMSYLNKIIAPTLLIRAEQSFLAAAGLLENRINAIDNISVVTLPGNHHLHLETETMPSVAEEINTFLAARISK